METVRVSRRLMAVVFACSLLFAFVGVTALLSVTTPAPATKPIASVSAAAGSGIARATSTSPSPQATDLASWVPPSASPTEPAPSDATATQVPDVPVPCEPTATTPIPQEMTQSGWRRGGTAQIVLAPYHRIVTTPTGYLATIDQGDGYALCWSPNLVDWYPPDSGHFVNATGSAFFPVAAVAVANGYGAASVASPSAYRADGFQGVQGSSDILGQLYFEDW